MSKKLPPKNVITMPSARGFNALDVAALELSPDLAHRVETLACIEVVRESVAAPGEPMPQMIPELAVFSAQAVMNLTKTQALTAGQVVMPSEWTARLEQAQEDYLSQVRDTLRLSDQAVADVLAYVEVLRRQRCICSAAEALSSTRGKVEAAAGEPAPPAPDVAELDRLDTLFIALDDEVRARNQGNAKTPYLHLLSYGGGSALAGFGFGILTMDLHAGVVLGGICATLGAVASYYLRATSMGSSLARFALELVAPYEAELCEHFNRKADASARQICKDYAHQLLYALESSPAWHDLKPLRKADLLRQLENEFELPGSDGFFLPCDPGCESLDGTELARLCLQKHVPPGERIRFIRECMASLRAATDALPLSEAARTFPACLRQQARSLMGSAFGLPEVISIMLNHGYERHLRDRLDILASVASASYRQNRRATLNNEQVGVWEAGLPGAGSHHSLVNLVRQVRPGITAFHESHYRNAIELIWHATNLQPADSERHELGGQALTAQMRKYKA